MTLVVVDMQPYFPAYRDTLKGVRKRIRKAKKKREPIVMLGLVDCGQIGPAIQRTLGDYDRVAYAIKVEEDGSAEFIGAAVELNADLSHVVVTGVDSCKCVYQTALGIRKRFPFSVVEVPSDAIGCGCCPSLEHELLVQEWLVEV